MNAARDTKMLHGMIMAGGGGTRFWPRSRQNRPKQFLSLTDGRSLLQQAFDRMEAVVPRENIWVITADRYREETARQLPGLPRDQIVGEPCGRDTAPCIALGAALISRQDPAAVILVTPADHVIEPAQEFVRAAQVAVRIAEENPAGLVTIGVPPSYPATGYGYIQRAREAMRRQGIDIFRVLGFREKPKAEVAEAMVSSGDYFWNSGIFAWQASAILKELADHRPPLHAAARHIADAWATPARQEVFEAEYDRIERISIDYAVMEKARETYVVQAPFRWDDVGSWLALERLHPQDADGNTVLASHCGIDTKNCIIVADAGQLLATVGVENLIIIQEGDAILVADRKNEAGIRQIVDLLKTRGLEKYL